MDQEIQEQETDDLSADLAAAFDHIESGGAAPDEPVLEIDEQPDDLPVAAAPEQPAPETLSDAPEASQQKAAEQPTEQTQAVPDRTASAPSSWTRETASKWAELPAEVRAEIHRRETEYHKGIEQYKQGSQVAQEVQQVFAPYMQNFQQAGVHPMQAVNHLLGVENTLRHGSHDQKAQVLAQIARDYGVDLGGVRPLPPMDPQMQALMQQNQQLQQFQQATLQQQQQTALNEIQTFGANPANVHFEAVKGDMATLLTSGQASSLQDAYDKAVWMRPDIRQTLVQQQRTDAGKQTAEQQRQARAKSAAGGVKGAANPKATTLNPDASLRDTLNAALDGNL